MLSNRNPVKGGMYGEYPSLKEADQLDGDLHFNVDYRSVYSTIVEKWMGLDAKSPSAATMNILTLSKSNGLIDTVSPKVRINDGW
ncbi:MAG: hypothetical protein Ct9H300mP11_25850 [Chloroflexota bacterium]|nr:MAG: hypothetical protein Ct9H300mP11_25850 [Chloroflexota bacterium]